MRGSAPLSNEGCSLVLDIYLGGVSGAIVKNGVIEHVLHTKTPIPEENTVIALLQKTESLLQTTLDGLVPKKQILKTYIFIDAPLVYVESHEVLFQKDDKSFFETKYREIESDALTLPETYKNLLREHAADGVVIEHAPKNHTLNGYKASNLSLEGERKAQVSQEWIQRIVYTAIQQAKRSYSLGEIVFLLVPTTQKHSCVFVLGDVVSVLYIENKCLLIGAGTSLSIEKLAHSKMHSQAHIESALKSIERSHGVKDQIYTETVHIFSKAFSQAFKSTKQVSHGIHTGLFVGESFMFPVIKEVLVPFENLQFTQFHKDKNARLVYIIKNEVQ